MKIVINTRTKSITGIPTKTEQGYNEKQMGELNAHILTMLCMALAYHIREIAKTGGQQKKLVDHLAVTINGILEKLEAES